MKVKRIFKDVMKKQVRTSLILYNEWDWSVSAALGGVGCVVLPPSGLLIYVIWYVSKKLFSKLGR